MTAACGLLLALGEVKKELSFAAAGAHGPDGAAQQLACFNLVKGGNPHKIRIEKKNRFPWADHKFGTKVLASCGSMVVINPRITTNRTMRNSTMISRY